MGRWHKSRSKVNYPKLHLTRSSVLDNTTDTTLPSLLDSWTVDPEEDILDDFESQENRGINFDLICPRGAA